MRCGETHIGTWRKLNPEDAEGAISRGIYSVFLRASPAVPRLGPRTPFFTSERRYSAQPRPRFLVFARIWAFIHPASPGHLRLSEARSGTLDETKTRETASRPRVSARERVVPRH
jgi:hypothetical protein